MLEITHLDTYRSQKTRTREAGLSVLSGLQATHARLRDRLLADRDRTIERRLPGKIEIPHLNYPLQQVFFEMSEFRPDMIQVHECRRWRDRTFFQWDEETPFAWETEAVDDFVIFDTGSFQRYRITKPKSPAIEDLTEVRRILAMISPENPIATPYLLDSVDYFNSLVAPYLSS